MTIKELKSVCPCGAIMFMHDKNSCQNIFIPFDEKDDIFKKYPTLKYRMPYINSLKVKEIYSDNGVVAEIKFDKEYWRMYRKLQKLKENKK